MEQLIIRLLDNKSDELHGEWLLLGNRRKIAESAAPAPLASLAGTIKPAREKRTIIVLVPGADVGMLTTDISAQQRRHIKNVLPYLLEEKLADDITILHLAKGTLDTVTNKLAVAIVRKNLMQYWLHELYTAQLFPHIMLAETQIMPYNPNKWSMAYDDYKVWLRISYNEVFTIERSMLHPLLALLLPKKPATVTLECYIPSTLQENTMETELQQNYPQLSVQVKPVDSVMDFFRAQYLQQPTPMPDINLLQGEFSAIYDKTEVKSRWKKLVYLAMLGFIVQMSVDGGQAIYFSYKSSQFYHKSAALYAELFPMDNKIINPIQQMKDHIARKDASNLDGFLLMMQQIGQNWNTTNKGALKIENMTFNDDNQICILTITADNLEALKNLIQTLNTHNMHAKTVSLVNDKNGVKAQLSIKETRQ